MRILHLIAGRAALPGMPDHAAMAPMLACARHIADSPADQHRVVLLGGADARQDAALARLRVDRHLRVPLGLAQLAWTRVREERAWNPERVSIWSPGLASLARHFAPAPIDPAPWSADAKGLTPGAAHDNGRDAASRARLRSILGASGVGPVVALLADPPSAGDARRFVFNLGLMEVGIGPVLGVASGGSFALDRARRLHRLSVRRSPLVIIGGSVVPWLGAADLAVLEGDSHHARLAAGLALAQGLTLVAPAWLGELHPEHVGHRLHLTDGRTRTMLPALLRALRHSNAPHAPDPSRSQESGA